MHLKIEVMRESKKDNYWATSVKRFVTDGVDKFKEEGIIRVNLRDIGNDMDKFLCGIAHEASHLLDDGPNLREEILAYLKENITGRL